MTSHRNALNARVELVVCIPCDKYWSYVMALAKAIHAHMMRLNKPIGVMSGKSFTVQQDGLILACIYL